MYTHQNTYNTQLGSDIPLRYFSQLAQEEWVPHPHQSGTYIKRHGYTWNTIHVHMASQPTNKLTMLGNNEKFYKHSYQDQHSAPNSTEVYF